MNFTSVATFLDSDATVEQVMVAPGTLVLFRGRNAIHHVTPTVDARTRILVVLAYNASRHRPFRGRPHDFFWPSRLSVMGTAQLNATSLCSAFCTTGKPL